MLFRHLGPPVDMLGTMRQVPLAASGLIMLSLLGACSANKAVDDGSVASVGGVARWDVPPGRYGEAFHHARDVLRDWNFTLERVDAQGGVIATQQKGTAGLVTPWDREQSGLGQEVEDTLQRQKRAVRIDFVPGGGDVTVDDLRKAPGPVQMRVSVDVYRWQRSGWRLNTQAVLYSTYTRDPQGDESGMSSYGVAVGKDEQLAARVLDEVRRRLDGAAAR